jgi:hypothetical protein
LAGCIPFSDGGQKPDRTWQAIYHDFDVAKSLLGGGMTAHKRTEITVETDRVLIVRRRRALRIWCPGCGSEVDMVGLGEGEALTGVSAQALQDRAQTGRWHLAESPNGSLLICLESLLKDM